MNKSVKQSMNEIIIFLVHLQYYLYPKQNKKSTKANWYLIWDLNLIAIKLFIVQNLDLGFIYLIH